MEEFKYVIFQLGQQKYGMNLMFISGIEQEYQIVPVPNAPAGIKGLINLRKTVIPVYSLRERFGMSSRVDNGKGSLLVTYSNGTLLAYEVDAVLGIEEMNPNSIHRMPAMASNEETSLMEEVLQVGKDIVIAISVDEVLSEDVRQSLAQMVEEEK